jgi:excisionase family DNA binding protein
VTASSQPVSAELDRAKRWSQNETPDRVDEPFYTVAGLAKKLAISERTVRTMLNRGDLPCYRIGPQRRIDPAGVRRWLEQQRERR